MTLSLTLAPLRIRDSAKDSAAKYREATQRLARNCVSTRTTLFLLLSLSAVNSVTAYFREVSLFFDFDFLIIMLINVFFAGHSEEVVSGHERERRPPRRLYRRKLSCFCISTPAKPHRILRRRMSKPS